MIHTFHICNDRKKEKEDQSHWSSSFLKCYAHPLIIQEPHFAVFVQEAVRCRHHQLSSPCFFYLSLPQFQFQLPISHADKAIIGQQKRSLLWNHRYYKEVTDLPANIRSRKLTVSCPASLYLFRTASAHRSCHSSMKFFSCVMLIISPSQLGQTKTTLPS